VDDQFAPLAEKIQAALRNKNHGQARTLLINTHYHGDHTGGNVPFNNAGSTLIAQDNVRSGSKRRHRGHGGSIKMDVKPAEKAALPIITFEHDVTVHLNGETFARYTFPPATPTATPSFSFRKIMSCTWGRFRALRFPVH